MVIGGQWGKREHETIMNQDHPNTAEVKWAGSYIPTTTCENTREYWLNQVFMLVESTKIHETHK
jgi:hypothetical protein